jgi:hypothetical protein
MSGLLAILIAQSSFPLSLQLILRDWGLHSSAVLSATVLTGTLLGCGVWSDNLRRKVTLACMVPCGLLALHELMQWLYPKGPRDTFDSLRDLSLNILGTVSGWLILRYTAPARPGPMDPGPF